MKKLLAFLLPLALTLSLTACAPRDEREDENAQYSAKPVIYLYPEEEQDEVCDAKPVAYAVRRRTAHQPASQSGRHHAGCADR